LPGAVQRAANTYDPELRQGVCLPLTVLNLMVLAPLVTVQLGACLVCMDRTDPVGMAEWIRDERIATFSAVPAMVHGLLTHPGVTDEHLQSLVRPGVGGADLPEAFRELYRARFGVEVTVGYGLTEAPTAVTVTDPTEPPIPSEAGAALPHVDIVIIDEHDHPVPAGEVGEICVAPRRTGPWRGVYTPMLGYWNRPDETRLALRGGRLHTGDLGCLDAAGHLFVKDRRNDLIIRGGANIYPAEVERVLHADERVAACAVTGVPDEHYGERVVAFVQRAPGGAVTGDDLAAHCATRLARYKVPERWIFVDDFERTPMGKIRKGALPEPVEERGD
jgi:acyl-CoA synthetase (AMP-forming)/AMP-acid ligase II